MNLFNTKPMNKLRVHLLLSIFLSFNLLNAQESKSSFIGYGGIGFGTVENDNALNYNLNSNSGAILFNYKIGERFGLSSGLGLNKLSGNGSNYLGDFNHIRSVIKIPLLVSFDSNIAEKIKIMFFLGPYVQHIAEDEFRYLNERQQDVFEGWNIGGQFNLSFLYEFIDKVSVGLNYTCQSDITKFQTVPTKFFFDEQRLNNLNNIGIIFQIEL
ncbi:MAG: hypothetical protein CL844_09370 [Crocinitomicaceae bacterium]|nr:hypothetical protein [Crocinitomicaceae bacterium]